MPPIVVAASIAGAAGLGAAKIASSGAKSAAKTAAEAQQAQVDAQERAAAEAKRERDVAAAQKEQAVKDNPYPTYLSIPEAQQYKQTLQDRIAGRGLIDVNAQTAPVANQIRSGLKQTEAAISSTASARGLGRSTVPVAQIGEKSQAAERDIAERVSQLELQRQNQIDQSVRDFGTLSEQEAISQQNKASFERGGAFSVADTRAGNAETAKTDQFAIAETIRQKGAIEAANQLKQSEIWASAITGISKTASQTAEELINGIDQTKEKKNAAQVAIAGGRTTNSFNSQGIGAGLGGF